MASAASSASAPGPCEAICEELRVVEQAERCAERIYTVFRWAVTDEFLVRYGGKP